MSDKRRKPRRVKASGFDGETGHVRFSGPPIADEAELRALIPDAQREMLRHQRNPAPKFGLRVAKW